MSYVTMREDLIEEFDRNNFGGNINNIHAFEYMYNNNDGCYINILYPGYNAGRKNTYDYKVEYNGQALSHSDIVRDLYNKSIQAPDLRNELENFIVDLAFNGDDVNLNGYPNIRDFNWNGGLPINNIHSLVPILTLQDDINFPRPEFLGRRMCFYRYLEGIRCMELGVDINHIVFLAEQRNRRNDMQPEFNYRNINLIND